jgi:hypothetical protein
MVVIWILGFFIVYRAGRAHISVTYVLSFLLFSFVSSRITGNAWLATVAPITGPMYQLFIFFMTTDPKTTVHSKTGQCVVVFLVALAEMILRLNEVVYAPFYALFLVGPLALIVDEWLRSKPHRSSSDSTSPAVVPARTPVHHEGTKVNEGHETSVFFPVVSAYRRTDHELWKLKALPPLSSGSADGRTFMTTRSSPSIFGATMYHGSIFTLCPTAVTRMRWSPLAFETS